MTRADGRLAELSRQIRQTRARYYDAAFDLEGAGEANALLDELWHLVQEQADLVWDNGDEGGYRNTYPTLGDVATDVANRLKAGRPGAVDP